MNIKKYCTTSALLLLGLLLLSTTACEADTSQTDQADEVEVADDFELTGTAEEGEPLYATNCATCHGADGKGDGPGGRALTPSPTDFTAGGLTPARIYKAVNEGGMAVGKAATMPPFGNSLNEEQLQDIVAYTLSFAN